MKIRNRAWAGDRSHLAQVFLPAVTTVADNPGANPVDLTQFCVTPPQFLKRQGQLQARFLLQSKDPARDAP
jgi:hypothetical protein